MRAAMTVAALAAALPVAAGNAAVSAIPTQATPTQISALAKSLKHPIYWLGPRPGFSYELTLTPAGRVYVRYLPKGVAVGDKRAIFKTVGTYPVKQAKKELLGAAKRLKRPVEKVPNGIAVTGRPPTSIFIAFGAAPFQIEVFTPSAKITRSAVFTTGIVPIS
jgi:hypothetical protein